MQLVDPRRLHSWFEKTVFIALLGAGFTQAQPAASEAEAAAKAGVFVEQMNAGNLPCRLDLLTDMPAVWSLTPDQLDAAFKTPAGVQVKKNPYFQWMTNSRTRAVFLETPYSNLKIDLQLFGGELSAREVIVDFLDGKLNGISISLYNRGDSGEIKAEEFQRRLTLCGKKISALLQVRPTAKKSDSSQPLPVEGWTWVSPNGLASLEHNPEANRSKVEFLRLKIAPRDTKGVFAAGFQGRVATVKLSDLPQNVTKTANGDVFIKDIPMVDQGQKGYCVVASAQRLFEYYGIPADQHQIAQVAGTDGTVGTDPVTMSNVLGKLDYRFKTRFKILAMSTGSGLVEVEARKMLVGKNYPETKFSKDIHNYIDDGIPVLWGLALGLFPEEPAIAQQSGGGHMRMIIGYNDKTGHLLFTDSWGAGHELKKMTLSNAYSSTLGLFVMFPTVR